MIKRVYLEITDACNLNCPFCTNEKGSSFMSFNDIKYCIDEIKKVTDYIYLHVLGEPTLHPDFKAILDYLDKKKMNLQLVSNGTLLKNYLSILEHPCLRKLSISLHSINHLDISDEYFNTIRNLIQNTDKVIELRFYNPNTLDEKLNAFLNELKNEYNFRISDKKNSYQIKENIYVYFEDFFHWPNIKDSFISEYGKCLGAKTQIAILHNLDVTICCLDPKGHNKIGNLKENDLLTILQDSLYQNAIQSLNQNKLPFELCRKCSYRLRFSKQ